MPDYKPWGGALSEDDGKADIVILGVPYDEMSTYRKGAALAPQAVREASSSHSVNPCTEEGHSLAEATHMVDRGDIVLPDGPEAVAAEIQKAVAKIIAAGAKPILIGGDGSITPPAAQALAEARGKIDILYIDAHLDLHEAYEGNPFSHGSGAYRMLSSIEFGRFVQLGIRMPAKGHLEMARERGIEVITAFHLVSPEDLQFENPLYLTIDMTCLDPAFAPGVGNPSPGGLSTRELLDILKSISGEIAAADVVELVPQYDLSQITTSAAVRLVMEIAGLMARVR